MVASSDKRQPSSDDQQRIACTLISILVKTMFVGAYIKTSVVTSGGQLGLCRYEDITVESREACDASETPAVHVS